MWWVHSAYQNGGIALVATWIFWVILSITLHELSHGWAALWQGDDTPRRLGRMTMNPVVHMGGLSLIVFAVIGIAWGAMPVEPSRFRDGRRGRTYVAAAGPLLNVALAIVCLSLWVLWVRLGPVEGNLARNLEVFFRLGGYLNIVLALLNLIPIPPLDGSNILAGLSFGMYQFYERPEIRQYGMIGLLVILMFGGPALMGAADLAIDGVASLFLPDHVLVRG